MHARCRCISPRVCQCCLPLVLAVGGREQAEALCTSCASSKFCSSRVAVGDLCVCTGNSFMLVALLAVMEEGGYAANGIKHCVRPMDMSGGLEG